MYNKLYNCKDAFLSLTDVRFDKEIATKLKRKLDEDPELNMPSQVSSESN